MELRDPRPEPPVKPKQPPVAPPAAKHWYELDFLVPYRDLVLVAGFATFETGLFLIPRFGLQVGLVTTGVGLMWAAWRVLIGP